MYRAARFLTSGLGLAVFFAMLAFGVPTAANATPMPMVPHARVDGLIVIGNPRNAPAYTLGPVYGPITSSLTGEWTYVCDTCSGYDVVAQGAASVVDGTLGAAASVTVTGAPPSSDYFALGLSNTRFLDFLTITGGSGAGVLQLASGVDGSVGQRGSGPNHSHADLFSLGPNTENVYTSLGSGSARCCFGETFNFDSVVNMWIPFTYGTPVELFVGFEAVGVFQAPDNGTPFTGTSDFYSTATLTSALVYEGSATSSGLVLGDRVTDATIRSVSGFGYGPSGLTVAGHCARTKNVALVCLWAGLAGSGRHAAAALLSQAWSQHIVGTRDEDRG